jgi:hypothetical protein
MLYINSPGLRAKAITYQDLVALTIKSGIQPQRAYMYLAGLGVRGELTRVFDDKSNDYGRPIKYAVFGDKPSFVTSAKVCSKCQRLSIDFA